MKTETDSEVIIDKKIIGSVIKAFLLTLIFSINIRALNTETFSIVTILPGYGFSQWIIVLGVSFVIYLSSFKCINTKSYHPKRLVCLSLIFGILNTMGLFMYYNDSLPRTAEAYVLFLLYILCCSYVFLLVSHCFLRGLEICNFKQEKHYLACNYKLPHFLHNNIFWVSFAVILLCWFPWILMYYPASMEWDVYYPLLQYLGQTPSNNHHPWFYTCIIGYFYSIGLFFNNKNLGIFLFIVLRAIVMAGIYAKCIKLIMKLGGQRWLSFLTLCFFALTPVWGAYAKHAFKDTTAAAFFCWFILSVIEWIYCFKQKKVSSVISIEVGTSSLLMSLVRHNCLYVAVPIIIFMAEFSIRSRLPKKIMICLLSGLAVFGCWNYYTMKVMHVKPGSIREAISIPLQQTARTVKCYKEQITPKEKEAIKSVLEYDNLSELYNPILSDPVKDTLHGSSKEIMQYFLVWAEMFFKYPKTYIEAAVAQSYGYYAFTKDQKPGAGNGNCGMTIFNWVKDRRFSEKLTCDYIHDFEGGRIFLDNWAKIWHKLPLLNITDTKCVYFWFAVLLGYGLFMRQEYLKLLPILAILLMAFSCMASPVNDCFRYFAPVAAATPALFILIREGY